jgi:hypothetical protein
VLVVDPFAGVTEDVRDALAGVPECERALLELRLSWPALGEREALIAARLRVFLLTWDPFGWMRDRGTAWATATGDGDSYEVVLYLTLHDAVRRARETARTIADVIGELAGSVLAVGAAHEELLVSGAYPQLAFAGEVPGPRRIVRHARADGSAFPRSWTSGARGCAPSTPSRRNGSSPSGSNARRRATATAGMRSWAGPRCSQSRRSGCRSGC